MILPVTQAQAAALAELADLRPAVPFVVIGATALGAHVRLPRPTADIDLVLVADPRQIRELGGRLKWRPGDNPLRWRCGADVVIDVLPASTTLVAAGLLALGDGLRTISLVGFDLALRHTCRATLPGRATEVDLPLLSVLVLLKMVAWLDRPHERGRDLGDIVTALDAALSADDPRRWEPGPISAAQLEYEDQSAFWLGHELAGLATAAHRRTVELFLKRVQDEEAPWLARAAREARLASSDAEETVGRRLRAFTRGLAS